MGVGWDEEIPAAHIRKWDEMRKGLSEIVSIEISRYSEHNMESLQMHGFADASEDAYAALVYLRSVTKEGKVVTSFVTAKAKVAPLSPVMVIARLQLCAAHLLTKLVSKLREIPEYADIRVNGWTDSMVALHWINGNPRRFASFIANRIAAINSVIPKENWFHVRREDNPADCASRGISGSLLLNHQLWWRGPNFLLERAFEFGSIPTCHADKNTLEERKVVMSTVCCDEAWDYLEKYSSLTRLLTITANFLRFVNNCKVKKANKLFEKYGIGKREDLIVGWLTTVELKNALTAVLKAVQMRYFGEYLAELQEGKQISGKELVKLNPILGQDGIIRVGGRLHNASFGYEQRHPAILPNKGNFVRLVMEDTHLKYLHAGPQLVGAVIRRKFWVLGARNAIRKYIHRCPDCQRYRARPMHQLMGNLPTGRFQKEKAFFNAGVDYAGPFMATPRRSRGSRSQKVYIAVYVCFSTKAVHLEMVSDLSSEAFLSSLHRFIARRGECKNLYSDNGTNFVGASNLLGELKDFLGRKKIQEKLNRAAVNDGINWHFIPPAAPNFGGLWEAAVKSAKFHLRRVAGNVMLSFEEFQILLCKIEACLNSRPLVPMSCEPDDFEPLTPAHFLVGTSLHLIPEPEYENVKPTLLSRFQLISKLQQVFWKRWQDEYVTLMQQRVKWNKRKENLKENDFEKFIVVVTILFESQRSRLNMVSSSGLYPNFANFSMIESTSS